MASPTRRHAIIRNAKFAPTYLLIRYSSARDVLCRFLTDPIRDRRLLIQAQSDQKDKGLRAKTDFKRNDALLSGEAIGAFGRTQIPSGFSSLTFRKWDLDIIPLSISNVDVSISPDLICEHPKNRQTGAAIIQLSKAVSSKSWRAEHSASVASLVWMQCEKTFGEGVNSQRKLCFSIDVFAQKITPAPTSYKRRMRDFEAACNEIAMFWPVITPPPDFSGAIP